MRNLHCDLPGGEPEVEDGAAHAPDLAGGNELVRDRGVLVARHTHHVLVQA